MKFPGKKLKHFAHTEHKSAIALGSNLGDSSTNLEQACIALDNSHGINIIARSSWYQTKPIGPPQPDYLNGCVLVKTILSPEDLLNNLQRIEDNFGRQRKIKWGARTLDLDIILYDDLIIQKSNLQIPHPYMRERAFVLEPLTEIAPDWIDPVTGQSIKNLSQK